MSWGGFPTIPTKKDDIPTKDCRRRRRYFMWRRWPWCGYCGKLLAANEATLDHIYPKRWGGTRRPHNVQILCVRCNNTKGGEIYSQEDLQALADLLRERLEIESRRELERIAQEMEEKLQWLTGK